MEIDVRKEMAELFDAPELLKNRRSESPPGEDSRTFEQKSSDLNLIIEPENVASSEDAIPSEDVVQKESNKKNKVPQPSSGILNEAESDVLFEDDLENPLGLNGSDLKCYKILVSEYGNRFSFYDGTPSMKPFYIYKAKSMSYLTSEFGIMNCKSLREEISDIHVDSSIQGIPSIESIQEKINETQRQQERLSEIITKVHQQYHVWNSALEMMKGKLWCVKDSKGQHKREGLVADHMDDVAYYVSEMRSVLDSGKHVDGVLSASSNSLSRQLSCIQEINKRDAIEFRDESPKHDTKPISEPLEDLDLIEEGTEIEYSPSKSPYKRELAGEIGFGIEKDDSDEIALMG